MVTKANQELEGDLLFEDPLTGELSKNYFPRDIPEVPNGFNIERVIYNPTNPELSGIVIVDRGTDERFALSKNVHTGRYSWI